MASNFFGQIFRMTSFGESHGPGIGVVIDGCPSGIALSKEDIDLQLALRKPAQTPYTSPRLEQDQAQILSGVFNGITTGTPIAILIQNQNADSSPYDSIKNLYRPGHANYTYLHKYGIFDFRGGGRASGRETAVRVAAGAVAKKILAHYNIDCVAFVLELGGISIDMPDVTDLLTLRQKTCINPLFCPDEKAASQMMKMLQEIIQERDSVGGILGCVAHLPPGLGEPIYCKLEAMLASAMLSIPATKGFEFGSGFSSARMKGSEHNDPFDIDDQGEVYTTSNFSGGTLGGISNGSPLFFRVAFKPTSSIKKAQQTVSLQGEKAVLQLPESAKHDPCVAIRAVPVVEAMTAIVLADALLMNRSSQLKMSSEEALQWTL